MFVSIIKKIYSILRINEKDKLKYECIKICMIYLVIGFLWIYFSDRIVNKLVRKKSILLIIGTYKGWLYVIVTSTILYLLISGLLKKVHLTEKRLNKSYEELSQANEELEACVKQLTNSEQKLKYLSYHDQLTVLYNRRFFQEELKRLDVERSFPLTIVMGDVNGLKLINDSFGHAMGDELLKKVAEIIIKGCRCDDITARLGGDEFVILLPKTGSYEAEQIIKRIKAMASTQKVNSVNISISFGYETKKNKEEKIEEIFKKAEDHMYKKKLFESPSMRGKTINAIISTLHEKNKREEHHSLRTSELCKSMGEALGLDEGEIEELKNVGLLHDIGKIAIEENILNKQEKLTDDEWKEIKRHPEIGYRILSTVNDMLEIAEYVLSHHERWDGMGYPKGLKGEEIPLQSRIISIADSYDAMTSERSYRSSLTEDVAIQELKINAGVQFEPELVRVFIEKVLDKALD
ncbi:bifunctional diguanylate cyclase/phosphohydrolase [Clostridium arbusti]|uniref:bifunctional diguanylate cyclase/phosphohydrolase n=1 Tax=Clostridium arbusti TaxID=1137848 RepID=UPI0002897CDF|nr:diguanylate cyclase [Clostridium arbusti]